MKQKDDPLLAADATRQKMTITHRGGARTLLTAMLATLIGTATLAATGGKAHANR
jgi:hypothetical protein